MDNTERINVLVLGNSGAGKSTLIKAISGTFVETGIGEGVTTNIAPFVSSTWPLRLIDTKGFEYNLIHQQRTIRQVNDYTKKLVKDASGAQTIDCVWYCIEGTARRMFSHNIDMMTRCIKGWKNVPVFAVITKSYSKLDIDSNIAEVQKAFAKHKNVNLQGVIPVVAEPYFITEDVIVEAMGIDELCDRTLAVGKDAKLISTVNLRRMEAEQVRHDAHVLVGTCAGAAAVIGAVPIPFADSLILVPLETFMTTQIFKIFGVKTSTNLIKGIVGSTAITKLAKLAIDQLKFIPVAGSVINAAVASFFVEALGVAVIALSDAITGGLVDQNRIEDVEKFIVDNLKNNKALAKGLSYVENNFGKLSGKTGKDIYETTAREIGKDD